MTAKSDQFKEDVRFRILRVLQENPESSQRDISRSLGVSLGCVNYCINALVEKGFIKIRNFGSSRNKLGYAYILTPAGVAEKGTLTGRFLQRKIKEYELIRAEVEAMQRELNRPL